MKILLSLVLFISSAALAGDVSAGGWGSRMQLEKAQIRDIIRQNLSGADREFTIKGERHRLIEQDVSDLELKTLNLDDSQKYLIQPK